MGATGLKGVEPTQITCTHTIHNNETIAITVQHNSSVTCMHRGSVSQVWTTTLNVTFITRVGKRFKVVVI